MMGVRDPCGDDDFYMHLFAMYVKHLQFGNNYTNKTGLRSATVTGYGVAVTYLFTLRGFRSPYDTSDPNNIGAILISNYKTEEDIAVQRLPLNSAIFAELQRSASAAKSNHSEKRVLYNITCLGRFIGNRLSENGQTSPSKIDYHVYPSGKQVIKAFTANDFVFIDSSGIAIPSHSLTEASADQIARVKITWRFKKIVEMAKQSRCQLTKIILSSAQSAQHSNWCCEHEAAISPTIDR